MGERYRPRWMDDGEPRPLAGDPVVWQFAGWQPRGLMPLVRAEGLEALVRGFQEGRQRGERDGAAANPADAFKATVVASFSMDDLERQSWLDELVEMYDEDASPIDLVLRARAAFEKRERIMAAQATMRVVVDEVVPMGRDEWEAAADRLRELALKREHERNRRFIITDLSES